MKVLCEICGKEFSKSYRLKKHLPIHSDIKSFSCKECGRDFKLNQHLKRHRKFNCHGNDLQSIMSNISNATFSCPKCPDKIFDKKKSLFSHISVIHGEKRYKCSKCDKQFVFQSQLNRHQSHHLHSCSICDITLSTFDKYQKHMTTHTVKKTHIQCKICSQMFLTGSYFDHMKTIHNEITYGCNICNKYFKYKRNLIHHIKRHTDDKYECTHKNCEKKFRSKETLNWHLEEHDSIKIASDDEKSDKSFEELLEVTKSWKRKYDSDLESI